MTDSDVQPPAAAEGKVKPKERRVIPGNFSYTTSPGVLGSVLEKLIAAERPAHFGADFMAAVLQATGGSARAVPPIFKKAGLLSGDGTPTDLYAQFQSDSRRPKAALEALRTGWPEIFRRNTYAHRLDKAGIEDLFKEITGLPKSDPVFKAIASTFDAFHAYAKGAEADAASAEPKGHADPAPTVPAGESPGGVRLGLSNQINIILPETTDINVYNAIFKSLRDNLL